MKKVQLKTLVALCFAGCLGVFGLSACSAQDAASSVEGLTGGIAATADGIEIMEDDVTTQVEKTRASMGYTDEESWGTFLASSDMDPAAFREQVITYLLELKLLEKAAAEEGVEVSDEEVNAEYEVTKANFPSDEAWQEALTQVGYTDEDYRQDLKQSMIAKKLHDKIAETAEPVTDEELLETVKSYADYFDGAHRASHILFKIDDEETAKKVLEQLQKKEITFEDAAKQYSQDGSKDNGGDVGWDTLVGFDADFQEGLSALKKGEMSELVESQFGYHIILCTDEYNVPEDGVTSLDQVPAELTDYIRSMLDSDASQQAYTEWFEAYKEKSNIVINDMPEGLPYDLDITKYQSAASSEDLEGDGHDHEGEEGDVVEVDGEEDLTEEELSSEDLEIVEEGELTDEDIAAMLEESMVEEGAEGDTEAAA